MSSQNHIIAPLMMQSVFYRKAQTRTSNIPSTTFEILVAQTTRKRIKPWSKLSLKHFVTQTSTIWSTNSMNTRKNSVQFTHPGGLDTVSHYHHGSPPVLRV